jgi:hypothetical protein
LDISTQYATPLRSRFSVQIAFCFVFFAFDLSFTMPSPSTTSFILFEDRRVTRSITKLAAQGRGERAIFSSFCFGAVVLSHTAVAVIVRRPLAERTASVNVGAPLPVARKSYVVKPPAAKPVYSLPFPAYKTGFGFTTSGSARTPEERERLRKERLTFFRRGRAFRGRKHFPTIKVWAASAERGESYEREFVDPQTGCYRIIPSPALLAPPAINIGVLVLSPDMICLAPEIRKLAPHEWDEWRLTHRPELSRVVDPSLLFVRSTNSSGTLFPEDLKRYFPREWLRARVAQIREMPVGKKRRVKVLTVAKGGRRRRL